jgi:hypothetical protein
MTSVCLKTWQCVRSLNFSLFFEARALLFCVYFQRRRVWVVDWVGGWVGTCDGMKEDTRPGFRCALLRGRGERSPADTHPGIKPAAEERAPRISTSPTPTESRKMQTAHAVSTNAHNASNQPFVFPKDCQRDQDRSQYSHFPILSISFIFLNRFYSFFTWVL